MRVTETRMMELAADGVGRARDKAAGAAQAMTSGVRVALPSDDPTAWVEGMRAESRALMSGARGTAIARARDGLASADVALDGVGEALSRSLELAVQMANGALNAGDRRSAATVIQGLRDQAIGSANARGPDGEFVLAGAQGAAAPFTPAGAFVGDAQTRQVEDGEGVQQTVTVSGAGLTAAGGGVDVLAVMGKLAAALTANNVAGVKQSIGDLQAAVAQVADLRTTVGTYMSALDGADDARRGFEVRLADLHARAVESDPVGAASELARSQNALQAARTVAQQLADITRPR